jgi:hypothetical protein
MNKKAYEMKNIIGIIIFVVVIIFLVLFTKNQGSLSAVWQEILGWFS